MLLQKISIIYLEVTVALQSSYSVKSLAHAVIPSVWFLHWIRLLLLLCFTRDLVKWPEGREGGFFDFASDFLVDLFDPLTPHTRNTPKLNLVGTFSDISDYGPFDIPARELLNGTAVQTRCRKVCHTGTYRVPPKPRTHLLRFSLLISSRLTFFEWDAHNTRCMISAPLYFGQNSFAKGYWLLTVGLLSEERLR